MRLLALLLALALPGAATAEALNPVPITEWPVPWENSRPRDPFAAGADAVWFVGQRGDYMARLNPETGNFDQVPLDPGTGPHNLIVGRGGTVWYAGNRKAHIGRYHPDEGRIEKIPMPDANARDPHTLVFGPQGEIWFTMQHGNFVGRLDTASRAVDLVKVPTRSARPYGIVVAPSGRPWIVLFGTNKLATVDPATLALIEIALPRAEARPRRLGLTSDGGVWYVDYVGGFLGRYDPGSGAFGEWPLPSGAGAKPYGIVVDSKDRIWLVETGPSPNRFVGFDPAEATFFSVTDIPSGAGSVRHMHYRAETGEVWFGTDANTVGRAVVE